MTNTITLKDVTVHVNGETNTVTITAPLLDEIKKQFLDAQPTPDVNWRASEYGEGYFAILGDGGITFNLEKYSRVDQYRWDTLNYFRTAEEAERAKELALTRGRLIRKRDELWGFATNGMDNHWMIYKSSNGTWGSVNTRYSGVSDFAFNEKHEADQFLAACSADLEKYYGGK